VSPVLEDQPLAGRVCVVTGAAERVGREVALQLGRAGADVAITHWQQPGLAQEAVAEISASGRDALAVEIDAADPQGGQRLVDVVDARLGRIDVLVHNASNFVRRPFDEVTPEEFDLSFGVNLRGPFFLSQAMGKYMARQGRGKIFALVGNSYYEAWPDFAAHACAKVGLAKLMQLVAIRYAPHVQANAICPGRILASPHGQDHHIAETRGETEHQQPGGIELARTSPQDVGRLIVGLATMPAGLTGAIIPIDGGKAAL
jgi:NAD(P)-dependent dehydrogenase (short-subunit alcohol dehydrogenase family)